MLGVGSARCSRYIGRVQKTFNDKSVKADLECINEYFSCLPKSIVALEGHNRALERVREIVGKLKDLFRSLSPRLLSVNGKLELVLRKNSGFTDLCRLRDLANERTREEDLGWSLQELLSLDRSPATSCAVEGTFSQYKAILRENRRSFLFHNLKAFVVVTCNKFWTGFKVKQ